MVMNINNRFTVSNIEKGFKGYSAADKILSLTRKLVMERQRIHFSRCAISKPYIPNIKGEKAMTIDFQKLKGAQIPNINPLNDNGVRGITLSGKQNRKYIQSVKDAGVKTIIDLRGNDAYGEFSELCSRRGLKYKHFPIDSDTISDKDMLKYLPDLFKAMDEGEFYIACAQGLHRTDIAVALNYIFNPRASQIPPKMVGHITPDGTFKQEKIFKRANGIFRALTPESRASLGLDDKFTEAVFAEKKKSLVRANLEYAKSLNSESITR